MSLSTFYRDSDNIQRIIPIIHGKSSISLRLIDWFVTNYAKKRHIFIPIERNAVLASPLVHCNTDSSANTHINVYLSYRAQLKAYSKQQFDPFRRRERIMFCYEKNKGIETTIGQLNFFRWLLTNRILDYIFQNAPDIEKDMNEQSKIGGNDNEHSDESIDDDIKTSPHRELSASCTSSSTQSICHVVKMPGTVHRISFF